MGWGASVSAQKIREGSMCMSLPWIQLCLKYTSGFNSSRVTTSLSYCKMLISLPRLATDLQCFQLALFIHKHICQYFGQVPHTMLGVDTLWSVSHSLISYILWRLPSPEPVHSPMCKPVCAPCPVPPPNDKVWVQALMLLE